jgi:hypothetical protein
VTFYPELGPATQVAAGNHIRAVGWLSGRHPYPQGSAPAEFVERLTQFAERSAESTAAFHWPKFFGSHTCELCPRPAGRHAEDHRPEGHLNFGVPAGDILFVAPALIVHYVEAHRYAPPPEFIAAVLAAPLPGTAQYATAIARITQAKGPTA